MPRTPTAEEMLVLAFKKIDERVRREKEQAKKAEEFAKFKERQRQEELKRRKQNLVVYLLLSVFLLFIFSVIYRAQQDGVFYSFASRFIGNGIGAKQIDCAQPANWKNPQCLESRKNQIDSQWNSMMLNRGSKERPFAVHGEKE